MRLMYGAPPAPSSPRERFHLPTDQGSIVETIKARIEWLKRELKQVPAWEEELAILENMLNAHTPPKPPKSKKGTRK